MGAMTLQTWLLQTQSSIRIYAIIQILGTHTGAHLSLLRRLDGAYTGHHIHASGWSRHQGHWHHVPTLQREKTYRQYCVQQW